MSKGVYAGSFDPLTNGHLWMIEEGASLFSELIVAIGDNPEKRYSFTHSERVAMIEACVKHLPNVSVASFHNQFLIDYAKSINAKFILRGIRNLSDYEFERGMRHINHDIRADITTLFLMPPREKAEISSSFVKGLIGPENWQTVLQNYVPPAIFDLLIAQYKK